MCSSCEGFVPGLLLPAGFDSVLPFFTGIAWKSTFVLLTAFGAASLLRRASASVRHLVWSAAVICLLLLPLAYLTLPSWHVGLEPALETLWGEAAGSQSSGVATEFAAAPGSGLGREAVRRPATTTSSASSSGYISLSTGLIAVWAMGFGLAAARLWMGMRRVGGMTRGAQELNEGHWRQATTQIAAMLALRKPVALLQSNGVLIPMTAGVRRPVILLPNDAGEWPAERRWVVLAHELLHVRRGDYSLWMLARLACALYWFHPLVWFAAARLRKEAEQACDDGVLRLGAEAPAYAEHLVSLARGWSLARVEMSAMAMAQASHLESRVRALLDPTRNRGDVSARGRLWIAAAALLLLAPLATVRAPAQAPAASLHGTVSDTSGARVPGAFVTVQSLGDRGKAVAVANDAGEFAFPSLPAGDYTVEARKAGFQASQASVTLANGAQQGVEIALSVGSVVESIVIVGKSSAENTPSRSSGPPRRVRVGGNIQRSKLITHIQPIYPEDLQREGIEGMVVLDAVLATDGSLKDLRVANNLVDVDPRLVNAATEAIRFWRYEPTRLNGEPVEVLTSITLDFRLEP